jgi:hypothetical protein
MSQPFSDHAEAIALIIDTSSSAASDLNKAWLAAYKIHYTGLEHLKLFTLGSTEQISTETLRSSTSPDRRASISSTKPVA